MKVIKSWTIGTKVIEIAHETGVANESARWEFRVDGEVKIYGTGTPRKAREAVFARRNLAYLG